MINPYHFKTDIDLKSDKGKLQGTFEIEGKGEMWLRLIGSDISLRRKIGLGSMIDMAKIICDAVEFKCKKCKKKQSLEKGELHHGCLSCY